MQITNPPPKSILSLLRFRVARLIGRLPHFKGQNRFVRVLYGSHQVHKGALVSFDFVTSYFGLRYYGRTSEFIDWNVAVYEGAEKGLIDELLRIQRKFDPDIFLDIGANSGTFTLPLARHVQTYSFEPLSSNFSRLSKNVNENTDKLKKVHLEKFALSNVNSSVPIYTNHDSDNAGTASLSSAWHDSNTLLEEEVKALIFDELTEKIKCNRCLFKIDTEGHELEALKGMENFLKDTQCIGYIESDRDEVIQYLSSIGFRIEFFDIKRSSLRRGLAECKGHLLVSNYDLTT